MAIAIAGTNSDISTLEPESVLNYWILCLNLRDTCIVMRIDSKNYLLPRRNVVSVLVAHCGQLLIALRCIILNVQSVCRYQPRTVIDRLLGNTMVPDDQKMNDVDLDPRLLSDQCAEKLVHH